MKLNLFVLPLLIAVLVFYPNSVPIVSAGSIVAEIEDSYVSMEISTSVNASKHSDWKENQHKLVASAFKTPASKRGLITALGAVMNASIRRLISGSYITDLDVSIGEAVAGSASMVNINVSCDVHNVINKVLGNPHAINVRFRGMKVSENVAHGASVFNPAEMFLLDLSAFMVPMEKWNRTRFDGREAYRATLRTASIQTRFGTITIDPSEVIVLPANVVSSSSSKDTIIYYTVGDIVEFSIMAGVAVGAIVGAVFLLVRRVGKS